MSLAPGTKLGPYEIVAPLGSGGMGEVWRARDPRLDREVAIKSLPAEFAQNAERLARFEREAKILASLSHPNIAGIHGLEEVGGARYLVLELVSGESLAQRLSRGRLPLDETLALGRQVAAALEAAHDRGIVHRDLKPGNIMLTETGGAKVLDFGLAKGGVAAGTDSSPDLTASPTMTYGATQAGVILGTAAYMSPEQARGKNVDRRTDIWSFGVVLYECLTGKQAFEGETTSDLLARIIEREPDWRVLPASTPPRLVELLQRCLRREAKERLRDIGDARLDLDEIAPGGASAAPIAARAQPGRSTLWLAIAVSILLTALATAAAMRRWSRPPDGRPLRLSVQGPEGAVLSIEEHDIAISPDGSMLAIAATDSAGVSHLWLRSLSSVQPRLLPGTERATIPFWSPDSRNLAFFADGNLKRVTIMGEGMQILCAAPNPRGAAWGPGDVILFAPAASGPILQVSASGGQPKPATTLDAAKGESSHRFPSFLPDGRHFLYVALPGREYQYETRVGTLDGELGPAVVSATGVAVYAHPGFLVFMRQGTVFAQRFDVRALRTTGPALALRDLKDVAADYAGSPTVSVSADGILAQAAPNTSDERVEVMDREGRRLGSLPLPLGWLGQPRVSPDGKQLVLAHSKAGGTSSVIYIVDLVRGISARFTSDGPLNLSPIWTPDGRRVIYGSDRAGGRNLYWKRVAGGDEELLADVPNLFNDPNDVTPDGKFVVYRSLSGQTGEDLWIVGLEGDREARPLIQTQFNEENAVFSPDGKWMAYRSDESGGYEVYVQPFPALDHKVRISVDGTASPQVRNNLMRWSRDGRELYFTGRDGHTLMAAPIEPGPEFHAETPHPLLRLPREVVDATISPDGQRLYVILPTQPAGRGIIQLVMNWVGEWEEKK